MHSILSFIVCGTILLQIVSTTLLESSEHYENIFDTSEKSFDESFESSVTADDTNTFSTDRTASDSSESSQSATNQYDSTFSENIENTDYSQTTQKNLLTEDSTVMPSISTIKNFDISTITVKKSNSAVNVTIINVINKDSGSINIVAKKPNNLLLILLGVLVLCTVSVISFATYKMCKVKTKSEVAQPMSTQSSVKRHARYTMEMDELHRQNIEDLKTRFKSRHDRPTSNNENLSPCSSSTVCEQVMKGNEEIINESVLLNDVSSSVF